MSRLVMLKCIVEGTGDTEALPVLIDRIAKRAFPDIAVSCPNPIRQTRSKLLRPGELERSLILASRQLTSPGGILVLIDSDDDCPRDLGPQITQRAKHTIGHIRTIVSLAHREFESWFLAAAPSLSALPEFPSRIEAIPGAEHIRGAKERVTKLMIGDRIYKEAVDQRRLAKCVDLDMARSAPSFARFHDRVCELIGALIAA